LVCVTRKPAALGAQTERPGVAVPVRTLACRRGFTGPD
jgi:hypothetical protein